MPKKTNYIPYKLKKLEKYLSELEGYLDENPLKDITDRVEVYESTRGNPIVKLISSKEQQLRAYGETLKLLPRLYEDYNKLLAAVNGKEQDDLRGGKQAGGVMDNDDDEYNDSNNEYSDYEDIQPKKLKSPAKLLTNNPSYEEPVFDE